MATWMEVAVAVVALVVSNWLTQRLHRTSEATARQLSADVIANSQRQATETLRNATEDQTRRQITAAEIAAVKISTAMESGMTSLGKQFDRHELDDKENEAKLWAAHGQHSRELTSIATALAEHNVRIRTIEDSRK